MGFCLWFYQGATFCVKSVTRRKEAGINEEGGRVWGVEVQVRVKGDISMCVTVS